MSGRFRCPMCNEWEGPDHSADCPFSAKHVQEHGEIMCAWNKCEATDHPRNMDKCGWGWVDEDVWAKGYPELCAAGWCGFLCGEHTREYLRGLVSLQGTENSLWCERCDYSGTVVTNWIYTHITGKCPECRGLGAILRGVEYKESA